MSFEELKRRLNVRTYPSRLAVPLTLINPFTTAKKIAYTKDRSYRNNLFFSPDFPPFFSEAGKAGNVSKVRKFNRGGEMFGTLSVPHYLEGKF